MTPAERAARLVAKIVLAGPLDAKSMAMRMRAVAGKSPRWFGPIARRLARDFGLEKRPSRVQVARLIARGKGFQSAYHKGQVVVDPAKAINPVMSPAKGEPAAWTLPSIVTPHALAVWLNLTLGELAWFADLGNWNGRRGARRFRHYTLQWIPKRSGGGRLLEAPKLRLKLLQRQILHQILEKIPAHEDAHGFINGRSTKTYIAAHIGKPTVLRMDLRDFFPSIRRPRISAIFRSCGYPSDVADLLGGLCTTATPVDEIAHLAPPLNIEAARKARDRYRSPHLPQGAPSSPALANLAAFRLDCRLAGLARKARAQYTRYADDLLFSADKPFARGVDRFALAVGIIALEEGFEVHTRKTRVMNRSIRQHAAGMVINEHPNLARPEWDRLKAILHNCVRQGPAGQNRENLPNFQEHLAGRVAYAASVNPTRAEKLRALYDRIDWGEEGGNGVRL
jgi:hypothetical protein